jgi:hypothetical protein
VWTHRHDETNRLFSRLRRTRLETWVNKFYVWRVPLLPHGQMVSAIKSHSRTKQALKHVIWSSKQKYSSKQTQPHLQYGISSTEINERQPWFVLRCTFQDEASSALWVSPHVWCQCCLNKWTDVYKTCWTSVFRRGVNEIRAKFYVHHSVHRESITKKFQLDDTLVQYFINSCKSLYMFRAKQSPIIRSSN